MPVAPLFFKYKLHHLLGWILIFIIWFVLREDDYPTQGKALLVTFIKVTELALMIYITNYVLIPRLLYKKKYTLFFLVFVVMIFTSSVVKISLLGRLLDNEQLIHWAKYIKHSLYNNIIPHFFLVIAGAAVKLMFDYGTLQKRMAETAKEKAEAELNFLKSQINPHFVFNSLNTVYFLIDKTNAAARNALHKFSDMLRYQLYEVKGNTIPIEKEIRYLKDYMDLQQLRKDEQYIVEFACAANVKGFSVEPLLLVPFVENAFKHISHYAERTNYVKVNLSRENGTFIFSVINSTDDQPTTELHGGIGLTNVKRRLELLYPGKHELKIDKSGHEFAVQLKIQVT